MKKPSKPTPIKSAKSAKAPAAKTAPRDLCAEITAKLVEQLEKGVAPWVKPWSGDGGVPVLSGLPRNGATGRAYHGANVLVLWASGFSDPRWITFQQALALGGSVRRGEKGQTICYWTSVAKKTEEAPADGEEATSRTRLICRAYTVFNVTQCDGLSLDAPPVAAPVTDVSVADAVAARVGARVTIGGERAYYSPSSDAIGMPAVKSFVDVSSYDAILLHELTHWTGHESRLDRDFAKSKRFGDDAYAFEELIAEIGSAFACAHLGVTGRLLSLIHI